MIINPPPKPILFLRTTDFNTNSPTLIDVPNLSFNADTYTTYLINIALFGNGNDVNNSFFPTLEIPAQSYISGGGIIARYLTDVYDFVPVYQGYELNPQVDMSASQMTYIANLSYIIKTTTTSGSIKIQIKMANGIDPIYCFAGSFFVIQQII